MSKINSTFLQFIVLNKLEALLPIFEASTTMQGYGHLNEIAALYGLMWNTPRFMLAFLTRLQGDERSAGEINNRTLYSSTITVELNFIF